MVNANLQQFDERLARINKRRINKRQRKISAGYRAVITYDGLIDARPLRRISPRFPTKGLLILLIAFFGFKVFLVTQLGAITYNDRVKKLRNGTVVEQAGAWAMQAGPVTGWIVGEITRGRG